MTKCLTEYLIEKIKIQDLCTQCKTLRAIHVCMSSDKGAGRPSKLRVVRWAQVLGNQMCCARAELEPGGQRLVLRCRPAARSPDTTALPHWTRTLERRPIDHDRHHKKKDQSRTSDISPSKDVSTGWRSNRPRQNRRADPLGPRQGWQVRSRQQRSLSETNQTMSSRLDINTRLATRMDGEGEWAPW